MATTTKSKPEGATIAPEFIVPDMASMFGDFDMKRIAIKVAIGYAFFVVSYIAAESAAVTLALLVSPLWLQLVIVFAAFAALLVTAVVVTPYVTNGIYDAGAWIGSKAKSFFASSKEKFSNIEMPSFVTKH